MMRSTNRIHDTAGWACPPAGRRAAGLTLSARPVLSILAVLSVLSLVAAGCGGDDDDGTSADSTIDDGSTTTSTDSVTASTADDDSTTSTSDSDGDTTSTGDSTSTSSGSSTTGDGDLPGEEIVLFVQDGDVLAVVGVADDDTLNVREAPGTDRDVVATAEPTADDLVATGRARSLPSTIWYEVEVDGVIGWVNSSFVAYIGPTDDATAEYLARGDRPTADNMTDLGRFVAAGFASTDPQSRIVQVVAPSTGDLSEVTYDVIGIGDDSVLGFRLHIFATSEDDGESLSLRTIERTTLCGRGLSGELCT